MTRLAAAILMLALWQVLAWALAGRFLIAGPVEVALFGRAHAGLLLRALAETGANAGAGFVAGNLVALALAGLVLVWPRLQGLVSGLALAVFCLPLVATGPILRVMLGPGAGPQIVLAALAVYYTTLIPLLAGLRAVPAGWLDLIRVYGRGRLAQLRHVRLRAALPYLAAGLQISAPAAFLGAMVGEFTGAERGLGVLTIRFLRALDVAGVWSVALLAAAVSATAYAMIGALARRLDPAPPVILAAPPAAGRGRGWWQGMAVVATLLVLWWVGMAAAGLSPFYAKRPLDVLAALLWAPDAAQTRAALAAALLQTGAHVLPGYGAGLALGAGLAVLVSLVPGLAVGVTPLAIALRSIPIVTTAPLIVLMVGRGAFGVIVLVAVMVFFPTFVACQYGLRQAPGQILDLLRVYDAGPLRRMVHVRIPAMLPALFAAARMSVPAAVLAVTVVEWLATGGGIGGLMALSSSVSDYDMLWAAVVLVTALSWLGHAAIARAQRRVLSRYAPEQVRS